METTDRLGIESNLYSGEKTDCFAHGKFNNGCGILNEMYCKKEICKFYKTKKQFEEGKKKK